ncbi:MAG: rhamnulokinase, partial [Candidatus Aminicenantes bacterium]|nr:rhamnulokinase [Candidatus Aminicenantes bacterium]
EDWAYISSGTWSLLGIETQMPIINDRALALNFTNEGGAGGTYRFLKNICGLWLLQACRKVWEKDRHFAYEDLVSAAEAAPAFLCLLDPDDPSFINPPDMPLAIRDYCSFTGQHVPESIPEYVRCILESLALKYRFVLDQLREMAPRPVRRIHVIGGGAKNRILNQFTANATGLEVVAGPVEATAAGNILVQAFSKDDALSLDSLRDVVRRSFPLTRYQPQEPELWEKVYKRFCSLIT